jgi:hypothetical protein
MLLDAGSGPRLRDGLREVGPHYPQDLCSMAEFNGDLPARYRMPLVVSYARG